MRRQLAEACDNHRIDHNDPPVDDEMMKRGDEVRRRQEMRRRGEKETIRDG